MSKRVTDDELLKLVHLVKARVATLPVITANERASIDAHHGAASALVNELVAERGARLSTPAGGYRLAVAGVAASCTSGHSGLLTNWINAAYRALDRRRAA